jgi:hypothetical protein
MMNGVTSVLLQHLIFLGTNLFLDLFGLFSLSTIFLNLTSYTTLLLINDPTLLTNTKIEDVI